MSAVNLTTTTIAERPPLRHFEVAQGVLAPMCFVGHFSTEECAAIRELGEREDFSAGTMTTAVQDYRACRLSRIRATPHNTWLFGKLSHLAARANAVFGLDIDATPLSLQYTQYEVGGKIDWHVDYDHGARQPRKLSMSVQLTPKQQYQGGALEFFPTGEMELARGVGTVIAFPSILAHRVTPIVSGERHALVAWFAGPRLR